MLDTLSVMVPERDLVSVVIVVFAAEVKERNGSQVTQHDLYPTASRYRLA
jgi:hypothetical protein